MKYAALVKAIQTANAQSQGRAAMAVNQAPILRNWRVGETRRRWQPPLTLLLTMLPLKYHISPAINVGSGIYNRSPGGFFELMPDPSETIKESRIMGQGLPGLTVGMKCAGSFGSAGSGMFWRFLECGVSLLFTDGMWRTGERHTGGTPFHARIR